jgi:hypothetical protein
MFLDGRPIALLPLSSPGPGVWSALAPFCMDTAIRLIDPVEEDHVWQGFAAAVSQWPSLGLLKLGALSQPASWTRLCAVASAQALPLRDDLPGPSYHVPLAADWPAFLAGLGPSMRDKLRRGHGFFARNPDRARVTLAIDPGEIDAAWDTLVRLYRLRWGHQLGGSPLCSARHVAFSRAVLQWAVAHEYGALLTLWYEGRRVAVGSMLHIPGQRIAYYHFTARDETIAPLPHALKSPGLILTGEVIHWAMGRGARTLCMGSGAADYKLLFGAREQPVWQPVLARSPLAVLLLPRLHGAVHVLTRLPVHLRYYARAVFSRHSI